MKIRRDANWEKLCVLPSASILGAAEILEETSARIVLVVEETGDFAGVVTDGDIRRGLLAGIGVDEPCRLVLNDSPETVSTDIPHGQVCAMMENQGLVALPIVGESTGIEGIWVSEVGDKTVPNLVVVMAGGRGVRLRPYTTDTPKPLVPLGNKPMLHHLLEGLSREGFTNVALSVNYLADQIEHSIGDGGTFGLNVSYIRETSPLGTAGSLGLISDSVESPFLVINADVVTGLRLSDVLEHHLKSQANITIGMRIHDVEHPFGVLDLVGSRVTGVREKPVWREFVSAGVYVLSPEILSLIEKGQYLDMPDLIVRGIQAELAVEGFPLHESWLDVGTPSDFIKAQQVRGTDRT